jgi:putative nucleotidyltransferase with HDIG domain
MGTSVPELPVRSMRQSPQSPVQRFARESTAPSPHERRFARAFESQLIPALRQPRDRLLELLEAELPDLGAVISTIESDPGLTVAVLRAANLKAERRDRAIASISNAVGALSRPKLRAVAGAMPTFGLFGDGGGGAPRAEEFRLHALATQRVAAHLRRETGLGTREELVVSSLLHDIGKLALLDAHERYGELISLPGTPEQRLALERRHVGLDHATAGSLLIRRLGLPARLGAVIERHHAEDARGDAGVIRVADMIAHYVAGRPVDRNELVRAAQALELDATGLGDVLYRLPAAGERRMPQLTPSPLSRRQTEILAQLAEGKIYKQIAEDLGVATSTVRTHVNYVYRKLGVNDRAQAVLLAKGRGWLP